MKLYHKQEPSSYKTLSPLHVKQVVLSEHVKHYKGHVKHYKVSPSS